MRPIPCFKQNRRPENVLTDGFATVGRRKYPVRDATFSIGARNESRVLSLMSALPVNAGTRAPSMRMLSRCSEHSLNVPVDSPHHVDARIGKSRPSAAPIRQPIAVCHSSISCSAFGRCEVVAGIARSHQLAPTRQQNIGSSKGRAQVAAGLGSCDQLSAVTDVLRAQLAFFSAASIAALSEQIVVLS